MNGNETATPVRAFNRAYINGQFVTPHGTQVVDLVNPTNNRVIGKVTMADEIDTRQAIGAAKGAFNTFSQSSKEYRMDCLQRLHDSVAKRMNHCIFDSPSRSHGRLRAQISRRGWQADARQSMAWRTCRALRMSPHHRNVASGRQSANEIPSQALQFPFDVFESPIWLPIE
jgi:hypothetical protein